MAALDVRTILLMMVATCFLLALCLRVAVTHHAMSLRRGLSKWMVALLLQALVFVLFALRGLAPDWLSVVFANTLFILSVVLNADAIQTFYRRSLSVWWYVLPPLWVIVGFSWTIHMTVARNIFGGFTFGTLIVAIVVMLLRREPGDEESRAKVLLLIAYIAGGFAFLFRALWSIFKPTTVGELLVADVPQQVSLLIAFGVLLMASVAFLIMHTDRAEQSAQKLALTDPLTGTFNRRTFMELAGKEYARARRNDTPLSVVMMDLDHFKDVNDRYGHLTGDAVLQRFVNIARACLRREDLLVRYGGEEFCVLLPAANADVAMALAERIRFAVQEAHFTVSTDKETKRLPVTVSGGVAALSGEGIVSETDLIARADEALYAAKAAGRNRVLMHPENTTLALLSRAAREDAQRRTEN